MKEYFVITDVHSYYSIMMDSLKEKGFDINNPEHIIISCGDNFDRGEESKQMLDFLYNLLSENRVYLIKGNHEALFQEMLYKNVPEQHDFTNGTTKTLKDISPLRPGWEGFSDFDVLWNFGWMKENYDKRIDEIISKSIDYLETEKYIFVHGWIPFNVHDYLYDPEWRTGDWDNARWVNGIDCWKRGIKVQDKTIICGHWHCSWGWSHIRQQRKEFPKFESKNWKKSFEPFIDDGIIALDACTAYSKISNVLHFTEEELGRIL